MSKRSKTKRGAPVAPPVAPATTSRPIFAATVGALGDLAGAFSVGFFFLLCSLLVASAPLTPAQFGYVVWSAVCCLILAVVMVTLKVYSAVIK